jgi:hypothetical protein
MEPSDHVPCVISISTSVPKAKIFCFENYWMEHKHFMDVVSHGWSVPTLQQDGTKILTAKFKNHAILRSNLFWALYIRINMAS